MDNHFTLQQHETTGANLQKTREFFILLGRAAQNIYGPGTPAARKAQTALVSLESLMDELRGLQALEHEGAADAYGGII